MPNWDKMSKEAIVTYFTVQSHHLLVRN